VLIPRIFHQIWLGPHPPPESHARYQQTWLDHHPGWKLHFWTEENLPTSLRRPEAAERLRAPAERSDILRLELLWQFGGVYVDPDFECLRSMEPLIENADLIVGLARSGGPSNALLGAVAAHRILNHALEQIRPREFPGYDSAATGPIFLGRLLSDNPGATALDWERFYPRTSDEIEEAYAICHAARPWKSLDEVRKALVKAEKRQKAAQQEIRHWRRRSEEAEAQHSAGEKAKAPRDDARPPAPAMKIPRIFHQIWLGPDPLPEEYARYQQTWLDHHPGWELRFWTEENLPTPLRRPEAAERLRVAAERSDILRLELLWRFGGVYLDSDFECLRSLEPLIADAELFVGLAGPNRVRNGLFGSVAGHPMLDRALDELRPREFYGYDMEAGPKFLDRILAARRDEVLFLEPDIFYATTPETKRTAYALHHAARSWKSAELLWNDVRREQQNMEQKLELELEKASRWRARCNEAEAELDRLRLSWPSRVTRRVGRVLSRSGQT
jgi:mannosyltransferase OCH1-like enzyme